MKHIKSIEFIDNDICQVVLDDFSVLNLDSFLISGSSLEPDTDVEDEVIEDIIFKNDCIKAQKLALKLLNTKMRSEKQLLKLLKEKNISEHVAMETVETMKECGYINDELYARTYIIYKLENSKKSFRAIAYDLKLEGVDSETIKYIYSNLDAEQCNILLPVDEDNVFADDFARAEQVAEKVLRGRNDETSLRKLQGVLQRNGFSWDEISHAVKKISKTDKENYD